MFTIVNNKVYLIEKEKMFPVNVSVENGIQKVGQAQDLPEGYSIYTLQEIHIKFNIKAERPYYFDKEKYQAEMKEKEVKEKAEEKEKIKEELRAEIEAEMKAKSKDKQDTPTKAKNDKAESKDKNDKIVEEPKEESK